MAAEHQPLKALLLILNLVALILTVILMTVATADTNSDVFDRSDGLVMDDEDPGHDFVPAAWTFQLWIIVYLWQFAWVFYSLTFIFRMNKYTDAYLYVDPSILPAAFSGIFILHLTISIAWLFSYDNNYYVASFVGQIAMALTLYICTFLAVFLLWHYQSCLGVSEMWANVILVHNGLALYAAWNTITALIGFHTLLVEVFDVKSKDAASAALAILLIIVVVYSGLEMWISKKRLRYVVTPYFTMIVALSGMIDAHDWDDDNGSNAWMKIVIMALVLIATFAKTAMIVFRIIKNPNKMDTCNQKGMSSEQKL